MVLVAQWGMAEDRGLGHIAAGLEQSIANKFMAPPGFVWMTACHVLHVALKKNVGANSAVAAATCTCAP